MNTSELKNVLVQRIAEIDDESFLQAIKTILDAKAEARTIRLTPGLSREIAASKREIEKGLFTGNDQLEKEIEEWLSEK